MTDDDETGTQIHERETARRLQQALTEMHNQRRDFLHARTIGQRDQTIHLQFQAALLDLVERLRPHAHDSDDWNDVMWLPQQVGTVTETHTEEVGLRRYQERSFERPKLISGDRLLNASRAVDRIAKEIGVEPSPDTGTGGIENGGIAR